LKKGHFVSDVRDAQRAESTKDRKKRNRDAHMKETDVNTVTTIDPGKKRKKRKGGTSFSNSKQRRRREQKKKEGADIEGRGTPTESQNTCVVDKGGLNLQSIDEEGEESGSQAPSMAESEHLNSSNESGSPEDIRDNSMNAVSLS
jgi:hypothetical protein